MFGATSLANFQTLSLPTDLGGGWGELSSVLIGTCCCHGKEKSNEASSETERESTGFRQHFTTDSLKL